MSCRISHQIEPAEYLADPRSEAFADFRDHYPRCTECSAEVRAWTELHARLAGSHPEPERLARYPRLPAEERAAVELHAASCRSCRDELAQLASFEPSRLTAATDPGRRTGLREVLAGLGRLLWHPVFAYLVAAALLVPALQRGGLPEPPPRALSPRAVAERDAPARPVLARAEPETFPSAAAQRGRAGAESEVAAPARSEQATERPAAEAAVLRLAAERRVAMLPPGPRQLELLVPLPEGAPVGGEARLRLVDATGRREMLERVPVPSGSGPGRPELVWRVPGGWLSAGSYRLELLLPGAAAPLHFSFVVAGG